MSVLIAHASIDENKNIKNGKAGDQTGKEVCIREWYNKPWNVMIRFKDPAKAEKVAQAMEWAACNDCIGYDQNQRNTLLTEARKVNFNLSKIKVKCETDCSGLVSVACMYAGISESALTYKGNCATTRTLKQLLKQTGEVDVYTTIPYLANSNKLRRGDILIKEGSHTCVVVKTDNDTVKKTAEEVAKEIIQGKGGWGNGTERRIKLIDAGYNPNEVQNIINSILKVVKTEDTAKFIWDFLMIKIGNPYGVAGLMGNLKAESNLNPKNLQNSFEKKLGLNDETYTVAVDNGIYKNFVTDCAGFGLAQWTYHTRKKALYEYRGSKSIGDLVMQLDFLYYELTNSYKTVLNALKSARSIKDASDIVLTKYERPKDQSDAVKTYRAKLSLEIYQKYN